MVGIKIKKTMQQWYKDPETAFSTFNLTGDKSEIQIDDILKVKLFLNRISYEPQDVISYLLRDKVFQDRDATLDY